MITLAEAKRTLFCVRSATRLVRVLTFVIIVIDIVCFALNLYVNQGFLVAGVLISGFAKFTKYFLYVWLFILTFTLVQFVWNSVDYLYTVLRKKCFPPNEYICDYTSNDIFLAIVICVTGLMLTVINLYTFCILHKNGLCFLFSINRDVEQANVSIQVSYGSTGTTASAPPDETSRILPPSHSVAINSPEIGSDFYVGNDRESLV